MIDEREKKMRKFCMILFAVIMLQAVCTAKTQQTEENMQSVISALNIMNGYPDGNFYAEEAVTRAQFAKIAVSASAYKNTVAFSSNTSPFKDVLYTHWAAPYIKVASVNKLVTGYPDSTFLPENTVTLAEAATVAVKLLGYSDSDFTSAWPYGQLGVAENIGLLDGLEVGIDTPLTRGQVMKLMYNTLMTKTKESSAIYLESMDYKFVEDVIIRATSDESAYVGADKVLTTGGTYQITDNFDKDWIGRRGDALVSSSDELVHFFADNQTKETYTVYSVTGGKIVLSDGNGMSEKTLDGSMAVYYDTDTQASTLDSLTANLDTGDLITVCKNENGITDYAFVFSSEAKTEGPVTAHGSSWKVTLGVKENATVLRDGKATTTGSIENNDILYYSASINILWAYSKKITGVYEKANPTKDNVESVVISGTEYAVESVAAMRKLSSGGSFNLGDTVTVLLGKDGKIADVIDPSENSSAIIGYLKSVGVKEYTDGNGNTSSTNYATIVMADGTEMDFNVTTKYEHLRSQMVRVVFSDDKTTLRKENAKTDLTGKVDYPAGKIGSVKVADNIEILDVSTTDSAETGSYASVFMQRINGLELRSSNILYYTLNDNGEADTLILKNVTGDMHDYGIVKSAPKSGGTYTCMVGTAEKSLSAGNSTFAVTTGQPVQIRMNGNSLDAISALQKIKYEITAVTETYIEANGEKHLLADGVAIYDGKFGTSYDTVLLSELIKNQENYDIEAYYDRAEKNGGRIRVLKVVKE